MPTEIVNQFKAAILGDRPSQIGLWSCLADPAAAEMLSTTGFDWMLLDAEHAPNDVRRLMSQLQATSPAPRRSWSVPPRAAPSGSSRSWTSAP